MENVYALMEAYRLLRNRLAGFVALPIASLHCVALPNRLGAIRGKQPAAGLKAVALPCRGCEMGHSSRERKR